jgi:uncharacterized protein YqgC (DUF456 family)
MNKLKAALGVSLVVFVKIVLVLLILAGIVLVPLGLPGTWIIVGGAVLYSFFYNFSPTSSDLWVIAILIILAVIGEVLEFLVGTLGGKKLEVSTGAIVASFVGGILGAIIGVPVFLIGSLLGLLLGVFLGALIYELIVTKDMGLALRAAIAVFFSRLVASFMKTCIAVVMGIYLGFKIF